MKLTVFNGSPRFTKSSTKLILDHFLEGYSSSNDNQHTIYYLCQTNKTDEHVSVFSESEYVLLAMPLYTDAMPAQVKTFIESLQKCKTGRNNPKMIFLIQSGFPEALQSIYLKDYFIKLTKRLHTEYLGTIIKGNANRLDEQPSMMTKGMYKTLKDLGRHFGETQQLDEQLLTKLGQPYQLSGFTIKLFEFMTKLNLNSALWDKKLKQNNVFEKRFDKPFF